MKRLTIYVVAVKESLKNMGQGWAGSSLMTKTFQNEKKQFKML